MNLASAPKRDTSAGASSRVALGILVSRVTGLMRETAIAHFFGNSSVAAFSALRFGFLTCSAIYSERAFSRQPLSLSTQSSAPDRKMKRQSMLRPLYSAFSQ